MNQSEKEEAKHHLVELYKKIEVKAANTDSQQALIIDNSSANINDIDAEEEYSLLESSLADSINMNSIFQMM